MNFLTNLKIKFLQKKGHKLFKKGNFNKAKHVYEKIVNLTNKSEDIFNLALVTLSLRDFDSSLNLFNKIKDQFPNNELLQLCLAESHTMLENWSEAEKIFKKLAITHPNNKRYHEYLQRAGDVVLREKYVLGEKKYFDAQQEIENKNYKIAKEKMEEAEKLLPNNAKLKNNLAFLYVKVFKDYSKATKLLRKATKIDPENVSYKKNLRKYAKKNK